MKMAVPPIAIASVTAEIPFKEGEGELKGFEVKSKDFDANVQGTISLKDPFSASRLDLYLTFKLLDAYVNKSESIKTLVSSLDMFSQAMKRAHRDDGYYGFRYRGPMGEGAVCAPGALYTSGEQPFGPPNPQLVAHPLPKKHGPASPAKSTHRCLWRWFFSGEQQTSPIPGSVSAQTRGKAAGYGSQSFSPGE